MGRKKAGTQSLWARAVELHRAGLSRDEIAAEMGESPRRVGVFMWRARNAGVKDTPRVYKNPKSAFAALRYAHQAGATVPLGTLGPVLSNYPADFGAWLIAQTTRHDKSIGDALLRIVKEKLYDTRDG